MGKVEVCDEIFAPIIHFHTLQHASLNPDADSSPQAEKAAIAWLNSIWAGMHFTVDEMIAEGDKVMVRWTFYGVHQGEYYGYPATHKPVSHAGINIFRIEDGQIAEAWDIYDRLWLLQQLGAIPETAEFIARARNAQNLQPEQNG